MPENEEEPKPLELPELIRTLKWIVLTRPRNLTEWFVWGCMSMFAIGVSVATVDGIYSGYRHSRHIRHEIYAEVDSPDFWRNNPLVPEAPYPHDRPAIPFNALALPAGASNTASYPVYHLVFSGTNFAGVTGGVIVNTDGVDVVEIVRKKPIV